MPVIAAVDPGANLSPVIVSGHLGVRPAAQKGLAQFRLWDG